MLKGFTKNGELKNVIVNDEGKLLVELSGGSGENQETTLNASVQSVGTQGTTININKKITSIDIANYSETADVTLTVGELTAMIGSNIATTLTINKEIQNISLLSTEDDTKVQIVVKGVE